MYCHRDQAAKSISDQQQPARLSPGSQDTSIIAHILRSPYISEDQRAADVVTMLVAGHDTTGYTLAWTIAEVSRHPDVAARVQVAIAYTIPLAVL